MVLTEVKLINEADWPPCPAWVEGTECWNNPCTFPKSSVRHLGHIWTKLMAQFSWIFLNIPLTHYQTRIWLHFTQFYNASVAVLNLFEFGAKRFVHSFWVLSSVQIQMKMLYWLCLVADWGSGPDAEFHRTERRIRRNVNKLRHEKSGQVGGHFDRRLENVPHVAR